MANTENTDKTADVKRRNVSTTLTEEQYEAFDNLCWKLRIRRPADLLRKAVVELIERESGDSAKVGSGAETVTTKPDSGKVSK